MSSTLFLALATLLASAGPASQSPRTTPESADAPAAGAVGPTTLIHGGRIHLNDGKGTVTEALLVRDGRVVAAGTSDALLARPGAETWARIDLGGGTAVPGLQDAHGRLQEYGARHEMLDLTGCASEEDLVERVVEYDEREPGNGWLLGRGWNHELWTDPGSLHHQALSKAVPDRPVLLWSFDGRAALANRAALQTAKLDGRLDPPPRLQGGRVLRDADRYATGVLVDSAIDLVLQRVPESTPNDRERRILAAQDELLALGVTCVHDMDVSHQDVQILRALRDRGELQLRVVVYLDGNDRLSSDMLEGLPQFDELDRLSILGVSLRVDGSLHMRGAAMLQDYADAPGVRGHTLLNKEDLARRVALITGARLQPAVQAVGNEANRMVLDVYQELAGFVDGFPRLRPRIEFAQVVAPRDWPRFPALGVIASVQPLASAEAFAWMGERLGSDRTRDSVAWRRLAPELGRLSFGSDAPSASASPLLGLRAARIGPGQESAGEEGFLPYEELDGAAVLAGFTSGPAYACHQDERRGRLAPGYAADLTVLDVDPVTCEPDELLDARVRMTVIDGRVVYRAGP